MINLFNDLIQLITFNTIDPSMPLEIIDPIYFIISLAIWYVALVKIPKKLLGKGLIK